MGRAAWPASLTHQPNAGRSSGVPAAIVHDMQGQVSVRSWRVSLAHGVPSLGLPCTLTPLAASDLPAHPSAGGPKGERGTRCRGQPLIRPHHVRRSIECALRGERKCRSAPDASARAGDEAVPASKSEFYDIAPCAMLDAHQPCSLTAVKQCLKPAESAVIEGGPASDIRVLNLSNARRWPLRARGQRREALQVFRRGLRSRGEPERQQSHTLSRKQMEYCGRPEHRRPGKSFRPRA
jgi:hypothetical protein